MQKDKVVIDTAEYGDNPVIELVCPKCNFILHVRLTGGDIITCYYCLTDIKPGDTQMVSILEDPNKAIETNAASIDYDFERDVAIRKELELVWGAKEMSRKGTIRFTSYTGGVG